MKRLLLLAALLADCAATPLFGQELRLDAVLHGGRDAVIAVGALPAGAEEWEAFLSADGGAHYAVRITPHLDASIHSYCFRVPNVATRDARILLRTGDEVHERIVMVPRSFTIEADFARVDYFRGEATDERGESARFDDDHVVEWRDADSDVRHRDTDAIDAISGIATESPDIAAPSSACALLAPARLTARRAASRKTCPTFRANRRDALLLSTRLNV
ncbi:MAG TPA: hypothetical protein VGR95_14900 [Thermoanaerobaculia bacterium]|jgi:hypothetical protein|nr:hypothetical protein [Thermoanaerobaculia bacterium]